ncbi:50S ribosomal protein L19e [Candidatus Woesearchaeota archaeon]|nr:50S ribosomal protein L19e [Candidatus Woesearchaeota archaeon]
MIQKRLASQLLKCSPKRIKFDESKLADIKEAITNADIKGLISSRAITRVPARGISRSRIRRNAAQLRKGRRKGKGSRRSNKTARLNPKRDWMNRIRLQRRFIQELREKGLITKQTYNNLYKKSKGGFFRNKRHIKLYVNEQKLITK